MSQIKAALLVLRPLCQEKGVPLIVNDHPTLALLADGIHLGQDDGPIDRRGLPEHCIVGRSTHTLQQALRAAEEGADYLGFGPLFVTNTKATGYEPRGLEQLREVVNAVQVPVVAIGGVQRKHIHKIQETGAAAWASISNILVDDNPGRQARRFSQLASDTQPSHLPRAEPGSPSRDGHEPGD